MTQEPTQSRYHDLLPLRRIYSGGQTGADRAALDVSRKFNFPYGGWCPKGRKAEDGPISKEYMLSESPSGNYLQRTEWNVRDSDGTVIFTMNKELTGGSKRTADFSHRHRKPCLHLHPLSPTPAQALCVFIREHKIQQLNVAGSRGSKEPDLHDWVCEVMEEALFHGEPERLIGEALSYLGPEIEINSAIEDAHAPEKYSRKNNPNCWRFYYRLKNATINMVGGDQHYLLVEKGTGRIQGTGIEINE